jgi:ABC-type transporter Mla subunit MlaD
VATIAEFARNNRQEFIDSLGNITTTMRTLLSRRRQLTEVLQVLPLAAQNLERTKRRDNRIRVRVEPERIAPVAGTLLELCQEDLAGTICELAVSGGTP